jgi:regulator of cell morphogenesis and NO signaling
MTLRSIETLVGEHRQVEEVLEQLEGRIDMFLTSAEVSADSQGEFKEIVNFLERDLGLHIRKEDEGLFPKLQRFFPPGMGPLVVMDMEHRQAERALAGLGEGVQGLDGAPASNGPAAAQVRDHGRMLVRVLRSHLMKEEQVLFPLADARLTAVEDEEILTKFNEITAETLTAS